MIEVGADVRPSMAVLLTPHEAQAKQAELTPDNLLALLRSGPAWWVRWNGRLVALGGLSVMWQGRAAVWGYLGGDAGPAMVCMTREVEKQLRAFAMDFPRIEAYVQRNHEAGHRWIRMLGFQKEGVMRKFANDHDYVMYARVT